MNKIKGKKKATKKKATFANKYRVPDQLWAEIEPVLPKHENTHRFGGGRPRVSDRQVMDAIFFVLRTGCQWNALDETGICSSSTAHRRFQQWAEQGVFLELWRRGLLAYDKHVGIDWEWCAMDGAMGKSPLGGGKNRAQSHRPGKARHQALRLV